MAAAAMHRAYVGLGSNLDRPVEQVRAALAALEALDGTALQACSSLYRTLPVGHADQPDFVNAVARIETVFDPYRLLAALLGIEQARGRVRTLPNGPRTLDLDLLLYAGERIDTPVLTVPHPRMHERAFVLLPLVEIAPDVVVPGRGRAADLLDRVGCAGVQRMAE